MSVDVDVLVVGAGLSGIGAACHLEERLPGTSYVVLEARETSGGTWDLFRYPGVRSDSDMYTLGYRFRPWTDARSIADGPSILRYVRETAEAYGVEDNIRYRQRVVSASWSSDAARWTVTTETGDVYTCGFLWCCSGYYRYDAGYSPDFEGVDSFAGTVVHPQHWPADLDVSGRRVVVIGSGATAVTLVPSLAEAGAHVTMLQRSPTYVLSVPGVDPAAAWLREHLPPRAASFLTRWKNVLVTSGFYQLSRRRPDYVRRLVRKGVASRLPDGFDVDAHFEPAYDPWDQRMCFVPDGDLFKAIRNGDVEVVTDHIERFTPSGLRLSVGPGARGRRGGHGDRAAAAGVRRDGARRRRLRRTPPGHDVLPGDAAVRRAELRLRHRLHQRVVDAEGRPRQRVRLPAALLPARARVRHRRPGARPVRGRGALHGLQLRVRPALAAPAAQAGLPRAVAAADELPARPGHDPPGPAGARVAAVLPVAVPGGVVTGIAETPEPPYVAVVFTSLRTDGDNGYAVMSARMDELAAQQPGYLGIEAAREGLGITVSYWVDEESARAWKEVAAHVVAQQRGRDTWYSDYRVRVATVTRDYGPLR